MGETVEKVVLKGDASDLRNEMDSTGQSITGSMLTAQLAAQALTKVLSAAWDTLKAGAEAAAENERTNIALKAALRGTGAEVENNAKALNFQASALEDMSGVSDEVIRKMQALAINTGVSTGEVDKYTRAAISMANTTGQDVNAAMQALIKLQSGVIDRNLKLIPGISDLTKEQLAAGEAVDLVNEAWGENLDLLQQGYTGQINELARAFENLGESIALDIMDDSGFLAELIGDVTFEIDRFTAAINRYGAVEGVARQLFGNLFGIEHVGPVITETSDVGAPTDAPAQGGGAQGRGARGGRGGRGGRRGRGAGAGGGAEGGFDFAGIGADTAGIGAQVTGELAGTTGFLEQGTESLGGEVAFVEEESAAGQMQRFIDQQKSAHATMLEQEEEFQSQLAEIRSTDIDDSIAAQMEKEDRKTELARKAAEERERIAEEELKSDINMALQGAGAVADALVTITNESAKTNKDMFEFNKAAAISSAIISGLAGVAQTIGSYPFPWFIPLAAAHAATAAAQVATIAGQQFQGGGSVAGPVAHGGSISTRAGAGGFGGAQSACGGGSSFGGDASGSLDRDAGRDGDNMSFTVVTFGEMSEQQVIQLRRQMEKVANKGF